MEVLIVIILIIIGVWYITSKELKKEKQSEYEEFKKSLEEIEMVDYKSVAYENLIEMDIDLGEKQLAVYSYYDKVMDIFDFDEILDFEVVENGESIISSKTGSAIVGGLLFGGIGAVAGASGSRTVSSTCNSLKLKIYTNNVSQSVITIEFAKKNLYKNSNLYKELTEVIDKMISFLKIAREDNRQEERKEDKKVIVDNVDDIKTDNDSLGQLEKLAELKEKGIITEQEFEEGKKKILNKL